MTVRPSRSRLSREQLIGNSSRNKHPDFPRSSSRGIARGIKLSMARAQKLLSQWNGNKVADPSRSRLEATSRARLLHSWIQVLRFLLSKSKTILISWRKEIYNAEKSPHAGGNLVFPRTSYSGRRALNPPELLSCWNGVNLGLGFHNFR